MKLLIVPIMRVPPFRNLTEAAFSPLAGVAARVGATPLSITIAAYASGLGSAAAIAAHFYFTGLVLIALHLLLSALSASIASLMKAQTRSSALDVSFNALVAGALPFAFAIADPGRALASSFLLLGIVASLSASLACRTSATASWLPSVHGLSSGRFVLFMAFAGACLMPNWFSVIAYTAGVLSFVLAGLWLAKDMADPDT